MPDNPPFQIRKATPDDAAELTVLGIVTFTETWAYNYAPETLQAYLSKAYDASTILSELSQDEISYLVVTDGERLIGFIKLSRRQQLADWITERCIEICRLYVLKDYHHQKIGKLLMEAAIEMAKQEKMQSLVLGVWEHNENAKAFYIRWGFEQIGTHPFFTADVRETDWVMRKAIDA